MVSSALIGALGHGSAHSLPRSTRDPWLRGERVGITPGLADSKRVIELVDSLFTCTGALGGRWGGAGPTVAIRRDALRSTLAKLWCGWC
jgi:hypothetical protein